MRRYWSSKPVSDEEYMRRLMSQVKKDASGCWLWTGPVNEWGYGYFAGRGDGAAADQCQLGRESVK